MTATSTSLTLVTGFWDPAALGREAGSRSADAYLRLFEEVRRTVPWPLVVWVDPGWADAVEAIVRRNAPADRRVIARGFETLRYAGDRSALAALRPFDNHDPWKDTVGFSIVMWAKPDLVADAIHLGGPPSARWAWIDFGIAHVADLGGVDWDAIASVAPEQVRLCTMRATAPSELDDLGAFYRWNRGKIAAGFFTGGAQAMLELRERFHAELVRMRATGRRVHDEQLLAALVAREPHLFERWYADYAGIITNYTGIRRDVPTILDGLAYCRERGLSALGTDVGRCLLDAMRDGHVRLAPAQAARLLHEAYICAYYEDRRLAERFARVLCALYHYGDEEFRSTLDAWGPLVERNLRYVDVDLDRPPWTPAEVLAQPDLDCWRPYLSPKRA